MTGTCAIRNWRTCQARFSTGARLVLKSTSFIHDHFPHDDDIATAGRSTLELVHNPAACYDVYIQASVEGLLQWLFRDTPPQPSPKIVKQYMDFGFSQCIELAESRVIWTSRIHHIISSFLQVPMLVVSRLLVDPRS
jgi:exopolysaccharide biosynthesis predicted pyruvyltransferase EpsI